jgi:uncharacterized membrane protein
MVHTWCCTPFNADKLTHQYLFVSFVSFSTLFIILDRPSVGDELIHSIAPIIDLESHNNYASHIVDGSYIWCCTAFNVDKLAHQYLFISFVSFSTFFIILYNPNVNYELIHSILPMSVVVKESEL